MRKNQRKATSAFREIHGFNLTCRLSLAALLAVAGILKLSDTGAPDASLSQVPHLAIFARGSTRMAIGAAEILIATLLLGRYWRVAVWASMLMIAAFASFIATLTHLDFPVHGCGCLGRVTLSFEAHRMLLLGAGCVAAGLLLDSDAKGLGSDRPVTRPEAEGPSQ